MYVPDSNFVDFKLEEVRYTAQLKKLDINPLEDTYDFEIKSVWKLGENDELRTTRWNQEDNLFSAAEKAVIDFCEKELDLLKRP